ncbi:MAG: 3-oxoacyl-ACP reductase FabG [Clostridia bacterium]|nr:3-oxoacyl-ACP reductase FabG [Clostridia bacterium]
MKKTVLVTGGTRGIGEATARLFAENGYNTVINYRESCEKAATLEKELSGKGLSVMTVKTDVSDPVQTEEMIKKITVRFGGVDILINNAGVAWQGLTQDMSDSDYRRVMDVNFGGVFNCTRAVLPYMISRKSGSIVNVSSVLGVSGGSCETVYSASKAAIIGFTAALSKEVGLSGIRVNAVAPGVIETDMNACHNEETMHELAECSALMKNGTAQEVARAIFFLAEDSASFITGQTLKVDGNVLI